MLSCSTLGTVVLKFAFGIFRFQGRGSILLSPREYSLAVDIFPPLNNEQMGLGALGELQMRSRRANNRSHTSFLSPVPPFKWDTWLDGSQWWVMTLWTGFKQQNFTSDESIGSNEEEAIVLLK